MTVAELLEGLVGGGASNEILNRQDLSLSDGSAHSKQVRVGPGCEFNNLASGPLCLKNFRLLLLSSLW